MDITLIIPAYNEEEFIGRCLGEAIKEARGRFKEIIVIDNASTDRTADIAKKHLGVRVVREEKKGLTYARQKGYEESSSEFLAFIDADCLLPKKWFETAHCLIKQHPNAVSWSGPVRYFDASVYQRFIMNLILWILAPIGYRIVGYMILGGNFIVRHSALSAIGGFDRSVVFYGEDMTLARRISSQGPTIFRMNFYVYTSARRFNVEGLFRTNFIYLLNFLWPVFFHSPFTISYRDVRLSSKSDAMN